MTGWLIPLMALIGILVGMVVRERSIENINLTVIKERTVYTNHTFYAYPDTRPYTLDVSDTIKFEYYIGDSLMLQDVWIATMIQEVTA